MAHLRTKPRVLSGPETHGSIFRDPRWVGRAAAGLTFLVLSLLFSFLMSAFIAGHFPDRPTPRDLLFETLPYFDTCQYTTDIALFSAIALAAFYSLRTVPEKFPSFLAMFGTMYTLRALIMVLTPLASAHGNGERFGLVPLIQNGMFPSGHAACALLCFLIIDPKLAPNLRRIVLALACITWLSLLLSHSHYSIDIVGGPLLSYFVWREWTVGTLLNPLKRFFRMPL
ncbi:MAG: phosphatase PAP2 family protein [Coriobacteriia bacterium]|nr:phosphatase PAP2 family protein [Coriobacteriia bacterium]